MLIREGAAARRRFMDGALCQLRPRYAEALTSYTRAYEHKTRILGTQRIIRTCWTLCRSSMPSWCIWEPC